MFFPLNSAGIIFWIFSFMYSEVSKLSKTNLNAALRTAEFMQIQSFFEKKQVIRKMTPTINKLVLCRQTPQQYPKIFYCLDKIDFQF